MTTLPNGITRYTGANTFTAEDAHGNVFYCFQKQKDAGCVVLVKPDGSATEVLSIPNSGRPSLDCNPLVGLWAVGNKETGSRATPPRYPIPAYVPFTASGGGGGGFTLLPAPAVASAWSGRTVQGGEWLDVPAVFGVPSASGYLLRLSAVAGAADVRARAGSEAAPYFLTVNTQVAGVEIHGQGWAPGPRCWVSTVNGSARVWLQVCGWM